WEIAHDAFKNEDLREVIMRLVSEQMIIQFDKGTGAGFITVFYLMYSDTYEPHVVGGSQAFTDAMEAFIKDHGGEIRTNAKITEVKTEGNKAVAFVLEDGEEVRGKKLVSTLHAKQLFGSNGIVDPSLVPEELTERIDNLRPSLYVGNIQNITLKEAPKFKLLDGGTANAVVMETSHGMDEFREMFEGFREGKPSPAGTSACCHASIVDPTRGGENGYTTLYLYNYQPYALYGDPENWKKYGQQIADENFSAYCELTENITPDSIVSRTIRTPLDYEQEFPSFLNGDFCHISQDGDQSGANRPSPLIKRYHTPIENLYLSGCSSWPGPTIVGGGRAVAQVIFEDLDIDFDDVING
ncbi:MAG: NAD(P)/FAD-dependent oxidoreductase, partial [Eggerthellaceae bacterium]|nr:NAD(P)/FAD-dependent oxidoreductase [Eggerthellaceae bacterium]